MSASCLQMVLSVDAAKGMAIIATDDSHSRTGTLSADQNLATVWLPTGSSRGIGFKPYLVTFKAGTAIAFYRDGKVQSGTIAGSQNLVRSIPVDGHPDFAMVDAGTFVQFSKDGFVLGF